MNCEFCNQGFSTKSNLTNHQRTVKKCLKLQEEHNPNIQVKSFKCEFCTKQLTSQFTLNYHLNNC